VTTKIGAAGEGLTLNEYQATAVKSDRKPETSLAFPLLGLFGEAGTLLSVVKKKQRDAATYLGYAPHVVEEFGDVLWYFAVVAHRGGVLLSDLANNLSCGPGDSEEGHDRDIWFRELQRASTGLKQAPTPDYQAGRLAGNQASLKRRLVAVLRVLVKAADEAGIALEAAAESNLQKIFDRWPVQRVYPAPLDEKDKPSEQLPRSLTIDIFEREVGGKLYVDGCRGDVLETFIAIGRDICAGELGKRSVRNRSANHRVDTSFLGVCAALGR
jgi:NTP pyrophosphatase (non-canonical NTP hydrolase)